MKHCSFIQACREFFGLRPGQSLQEFVAEIKQLTEGDKAELIVLFRGVNYDATRIS